MADNIRDIVTRDAFNDALNVVYQYIQDNAGNTGGGSFSGGVLDGVEGVNFTNGQYSLDDNGNMTLASTAEFKIFRNSGQEAITIDRIGIPSFKNGAKFEGITSFSSTVDVKALLQAKAIVTEGAVEGKTITARTTLTAKQGITFGDGSNCTIDKDGNVQLIDNRSTWQILGSTGEALMEAISDGFSGIAFPRSTHFRGTATFFGSTAFPNGLDVDTSNATECGFRYGVLCPADVANPEILNQINPDAVQSFQDTMKPGDTSMINFNQAFDSSQENGSFHFVNYDGIWVHGFMGALDIYEMSDANLKDIEDEHRTLTLEQIADAPSVSFKWKEIDPEQVMAAQPMTMAIADEDNAEEEANEKKPQSLLRQAAENLKKNGIKIGASAHTRDTHVGTLAQYWKDVLPEVVKEQPNGTLSMNYGAAAMTAVISLAREVKKLKVDIEKLKEGNQ